MATRLGLFNAALRELGDRELASESENREPRRVLDSCYAQVVEDCLEAGLWNFAKRTVQLDADTGITPNFGESEVFAKPADWVRTMMLSADETFGEPYLGYTDEGSNIIADATPLYVQYVSDDSGYGMSLSAWPRSFTRYVELELAERACLRITQNDTLRQALRADSAKALRSALGKDAMNEPTKFPPSGSWVRARGGASARDRGRRNTLTG